MNRDTQNLKVEAVNSLHAQKTADFYFCCFLTQLLFSNGEIYVSLKRAGSFESVPFKESVVGERHASDLQAR